MTAYAGNTKRMNEHFFEYSSSFQKKWCCSYIRKVLRSLCVWIEKKRNCFWFDSLHLGHCLLLLSTYKCSSPVRYFCMFWKILLGENKVVYFLTSAGGFSQGYGVTLPLPCCLICRLLLHLAVSHFIKNQICCSVCSIQPSCGNYCNR